MDKVLKALLMTDYAAYTAYVHNGMWQATRFHKYLCMRIQQFVTMETNNAFDIMIISTPPQHGKLIDDDVPVLTIDGWKRHGDLVVGDRVIGLNGEFVAVTNVHPKYYADRIVKFTDGSEIKCHHNHEWVVYDRVLKKVRKIETKQMECRLSNDSQEKKRGHRYNFLIPLKEPLKGVKRELPVDPYVLGVWLGDGKNNGGMCHATRRTEKHIPEDYLTADIEQRLELLAGLIDTDGYVDTKHNRIVFTTADVKLKDTFAELISTFGWRATVCECKPFTTSSGIVGKITYWQIGFNPTIEIPCRIPRKQMKRFSKQRRISICEIIPCEHTQGNCITVEGGIYCVGKTMIPTHNSLTLSETLPSWYLGRNPDHKVIEISYGEDFAKRFGKRNREKIRDYGGEIFGIKLGNPNTDLDFELRSGGKMISRGVHSAVTGERCNLMVIDDPVKNQQDADSETYREGVWDEWLYSFRSRLAVGAKVIVIMTRWHEDDLVGRLIANESNVTVLNLPITAEENDPLGRRVGEALCPEIGKDEEWITDFKKGYTSQAGSRAWEALYMGHPVALEGNLFRREWWQFYDELPEDCPDWLMSVDAAFKDKDDSDFVAIQVWAKSGADIYLVNAVKRHLNLPDTMREIIRLRAMYPECVTTLIEDKANGSAIIDILRKKMSGIIPVQPKGGKVARANAVIGAIESGNVFLPKKNFAYELVDECASFPNGLHDDQVDSMTQALNRLIYRKSALKGKKAHRNPFEEFFGLGETTNTSCVIGETINVI